MNPAVSQAIKTAVKTHQTKKHSPKSNNAQDVQTRVDGHKRTVITKDGRETVYWKGMEVTGDMHSRPRVGKTARDAASGAKRRNYENKQSRVSWQHDNKASTGNFPYNSCNGKRNRTIVTARGNERRVITYKMSK